jgi:hypothetical protein
MAKYTYEGNRDGNNHAVAIRYEDQGTVYVEGDPPEIRIGDEIDLTADERDRLAPYFILTDSKDKDVGEGLTPPTTAAPEPVHVEGSTSGTEGSLEGSKSPSASSTKR